MLIEMYNPTAGTAALLVVTRLTEEYEDGCVVEVEVQCWKCSD